MSFDNNTCCYRLGRATSTTLWIRTPSSLDGDPAMQWTGEVLGIHPPGSSEAEQHAFAVTTSNLL